MLYFLFIIAKKKPQKTLKQDQQQHNVITITKSINL